MSSRTRRVYSGRAYAARATFMWSVPCLGLAQVCALLAAMSWLQQLLRCSCCCCCLYFALFALLPLTFPTAKDFDLASKV
eukprot:12538052-Alexandrium_andersonii.AAC.1